MTQPSEFFTLQRKPNKKTGQFDSSDILYDAFIAKTAQLLMHKNGFAYFGDIETRQLYNTCLHWRAAKYLEKAGLAYQKLYPISYFYDDKIGVVNENFEDEHANGEELFGSYDEELDAIGLPKPSKLQFLMKDFNKSNAYSLFNIVDTIVHEFDHKATKSLIGDNYESKKVFLSPCKKSELHSYRLKATHTNLSKYIADYPEVVKDENEELVDIFENIDLHNYSSYMLNKNEIHARITAQTELEKFDEDIINKLSELKDLVPEEKIPEYGQFIIYLKKILDKMHVDSVLRNIECIRDAQANMEKLDNKVKKYARLVQEDALNRLKNMDFSKVSINHVREIASAYVCSQCLYTNAENNDAYVDLDLPDDRLIYELVDHPESEISSNALKKTLFKAHEKRATGTITNLHIIVDRLQNVDTNVLMYYYASIVKDEDRQQIKNSLKTSEETWKRFGQNYQPIADKFCIVSDLYEGKSNPLAATYKIDIQTKTGKSLEEINKELELFSSDSNEIA